MWHWQRQAIPSLATRRVEQPARTFKLLVSTPAPTATNTATNTALTTAEVLDLWLGSADFRRAWSAELQSIPLAAYCWEMPPLHPTRLHTPFECVLVESPLLVGIDADASPFTEPFAQHARHAKTALDAQIACFTNLGGDATLIAPLPLADPAVYPHLAEFIRRAPATQVDALWQQLAHTLHARLTDPSSQPFWLSTAGLGVSWLHLRLDRKPKYFRHLPYCQFA